MSETTQNNTSPAILIIYFIVITIIYAFLSIYNLYSKTDNNAISAARNNPVINLIYIIVLVIGTYFLNVNISKTICISNSVRWSDVFFITLLPWIMIFSLIYFLLEIFPGWVKPFSNTIGYMIVNALGAEDTIKKLIENTENKDSQDSTVLRAIANINKNYRRFINEIDLYPYKYDAFMKQLKDANIILDDNNNNNEILELYKHINAKHVIGKVMWYLLAGTLVASITYNTIINITCTKTTVETDDAYDKLINQSYTPIYGKSWSKVYDEDKLNNYQNYTYALPNLVNSYENHFINSESDKVEFTNHQLREIGLTLQELPRNIYIKVGGEYYIATG